LLQSDEERVEAVNKVRSWVKEVFDANRWGGGGGGGEGKEKEGRRTAGGIENEYPPSGSGGN